MTQRRRSGRSYFGQDRYAAFALGTRRPVGAAFADLDIFVAKRGLSESVVPGIDNEVLDVVGADATAVGHVRRSLFDRHAYREVWNQPTLPMQLHQYVSELVERGEVHVHLEFGRTSASDPLLLVGTTWLAPETLIRRQRKGHAVYEQFMSRRRFAGEPVIVQGEPHDLMIEIPADEVMNLSWPLEEPHRRRSPAQAALALERRAARQAQRTLLNARAAAEPNETFMPLARARAGAYADALEQRKAVSSRIKDLLLYPGAYEAEFFPWVGDVTDFFRADRILRSRVQICRIREYLFGQFNRQLLARWSALNGWGEVRLVLRADVFTEGDWRAMQHELQRGDLSLDDVRAAVAAEHESGHSFGRFAEAFRAATPK
jgi:hypothetical protein